MLEERELYLEQHQTKGNRSCIRDLLTSFGSSEDPGGLGEKLAPGGAGAVGAGSAGGEAIQERPCADPREREALRKETSRVRRNAIKLLCPWTYPLRRYVSRAHRTHSLNDLGGASRKVRFAPRTQTPNPDFRARSVPSAFPVGSFAPTWQTNRGMAISWSGRRQATSLSVFGGFWLAPLLLLFRSGLAPLLLHLELGLDALLL